MATIIRYVNTASSGGDGTTNGTSGGTAAYATLSAAETALRQDLTGVTCDQTDCDGATTIALRILVTGTSADTTAVSFSNASWVTDATHRIEVKLNGSPAGAKWDTSLYQLAVSSGYGVGSLSIGKALHIDLIDLQVDATNTLANAPLALKLLDFAWDVRVVGGFYRQSGTTGTWDGPAAIRVNANTAAWKLRMRNVTGVAYDGRGFVMDSASSTSVVFRAYNCTFVNKSANSRTLFNTNLPGGADFRAKNLLLQGAGTTNYSADNGTPDEAVTILSLDTSSPTVGLRSLTATFVDAANWDYHLAAASEGIDDGTDLSADTYWAFSTDGDGTTRSGTWDVGADEYVLSGTTLYLLDSAASGSNFGQLQVGGSAPSTATTATGWTVDTVGATNYALMAYASERASTTFSGTAQPAGNPDNSLGDCFRSTGTMSGDFATGVWTIAVPVIAVSAAAGQDGRVRVRLWKSANATGTSPTEITSGAVAGTTVTNLTTGAEQVSTVTTGSITGFSMTNEYLFVQIAWEITGAAT